jgi:hypothetical protein
VCSRTSERSRDGAPFSARSSLSSDSLSPKNPDDVAAYRVREARLLCPRAALTEALSRRSELATGRPLLTWSARCGAHASALWALSDRLARGELELKVRSRLLARRARVCSLPLYEKTEARQRRERLKQILALQRKLGHFEASNELGELGREERVARPPGALCKPWSTCHVHFLTGGTVAEDTDEDVERRQSERLAALVSLCYPPFFLLLTNQCRSASEEGWLLT